MEVPPICKKCSPLNSMFVLCRYSSANFNIYIWTYSCHLIISSKLFSYCYWSLVVVYVCVQRYHVHRYQASPYRQWWGCSCFGYSLGYLLQRFLFWNIPFNMFIHTLACSIRIFGRRILLRIFGRR
jgi:hypothetical protein